jgi:hypothetical protein
VLEHDRIELFFSGTLRRAADYRMEDATGVVLGQTSNASPGADGPGADLSRSERTDTT